MNLKEAWYTLNVNPIGIGRAYSVLTNNSKKKEFIVKQLELASKMARRLMALHHPDKNQDDEGAKERFQLVNEALEVIRDYSKKDLESMNEDTNSIKKIMITIG